MKLGKLRNQLGSGTLVKAPWWLLLFFKCNRSPQLEGRESGRAEEVEDTPRLEEVASYALAGRVESLTVLKSRVPGLQRDALLLTFR